ncbi:type II toxin-antitoxin system VapC family toxin [Microbacterium luticocti]|uniref:type II toxin-antitoxin system VapC family toxin n=1 Tax=Microbacterium luticocti TaxID=451764 RepID=UPI0003FA8A3F|nr:type II toxin-antitoxin system VapC family toxin [Microbacterium luticocti]
MPRVDDLSVEPVVVDASVVIALGTSRSDAASALADRLAATDLHAPHILPTEVDSGVRGLVLGHRLTPAQGTAAREVAQALPVELWPWSLLSDRAWELRDNLSSYDAGYVALAEHLGAPLITGDARLAHASGVRCPVEVYR